MLKEKWLGTVSSLLLIILMILATFTACHSGKDKGIRIGEQFGIAYAPLQIMREQGLLERELSGVKITWKQFGGPVPIREAMLAGEIDFAFMGPAPVLIGLDNGMEWKYATGISSNEVALVTDQERIKSLKDFRPDDRIAILSPGSTQHILLCMAAEKTFGDPNYFDRQIVSMSHPDAMDALMADTEIVAHFATPPYLQEELKAGMHIIVTGEELMGGPFTFITGVVLNKFYDENPEYYNAIIKCLNEAMDYINNNMEEACKILAPIYNITEKELMNQMTYGGTIYSSDLVGLDKLANSMLSMGLLKKPIKIKDVSISDQN